MSSDRHSPEAEPPGASIVAADASLAERRVKFAQSLSQLMGERTLRAMANHSISRGTVANFINLEKAALGQAPSRKMLERFLIRCRVTDSAEQQPYLAKYDALYGPPQGTTTRAVGWRNAAEPEASSAVAVALLWPRLARREPSTGAAGQLDAALEYLAGETLRYWQREAKARRVTTPSPAAVKWQWASADVGAAPMQMSGVLTEGMVSQLRERLYEPHTPGRIVILGAAGAGKTTAMLLLLIDILQHRSVASGQPVPVWITLGGWNPQTTPLRQWAATALKRDYPGLAATVHAGAGTADELLNVGRVALFLDGLDELPPAQRGPALEAIDRDSVGLHVVLTSRPDEYQAAIADRRLWGAAVVDILPVDIEHARDFLLAEQLDGPRRDWHRLINHLETHPESVAARTLTSPLALSLARDAYSHDDPVKLTNSQTHPTPEKLLQHLLYRSLILAYPDQVERDHAIRWLSWLAVRLGTNSDIRWWHIPNLIAGSRKMIMALVVGPVVGLLVGLMIGLPGVILGDSEGLTVGRNAGLIFGPAAAFIAALAIADQPRVFRFRWPEHDDLMLGLVFGLLAGSVLGLVSGLQFGLGFGVVNGLVSGVVFFCLPALSSAWSRPVPTTEAASPIEVYRADRRHTVSSGLVVGLVVGLVAGIMAGISAWQSLEYRLEFGLVSGPADVLAATLAVGFAIGLTYGFAAGLAFGLVFGRGPAVELIIVQLAWSLRGRSVQFLPLFQAALDRQIFRQVGAIYQFRHAALHDLLRNLGHG